MTDATSTTTTATPENLPLANSPEARTETGEIKNVSSAHEPKAEQSADGKTVEAKTTEAAGAPETYTAFTLPEGVTLDPKLLEAAAPIFKKQNLSQAAAQELVDFYAKSTQSQANLAIEAVNTMRASWRDQVAKDPALGPNLDNLKADIGRALNTLGDPKLVAEVKAAWDLTGVGDHPAMIKFMKKFAEAINEGAHVTGRGPSPVGQTPNGLAQRPSIASAMYPKLPS